jgi:cellulose synthase/poly-beta-1,6-N-acetylglucosamine synthase-like glycosyltransferase
MAIYFALVFGFYFLLMMILWLGWRKVLNRKATTPSKWNFISIVIAMRNEKQNLHDLFQSLSSLNYPSTEFEIIMVDDHSTDGSVEEAKKWILQFPSLTVLSLSEWQGGKKAALTYGISQAKGKLIASTDADCVLPAHWLQSINDAFQNKNTNMLIGAVALRNENKFFHQLQSIEFASVIGTGMSLCALGKPTMCNGANLSFRKKIFEEVNGYEGNEHIASGDDEFLMRKIEDNCQASIEVMNPHECVVSTSAQESVRDFIQQRLRWASKWKVNSSSFSRLLAVFIFIVQISWLGVIAWLIVDKSQWAILIVLLKLIFDFVFLSGICSSLKMKFNVLGFVSLQFLYPVYVFSIGIFSQVKNHQWKGRSVTD